MKFQTINGQLCLMTEPTPLTPEAKFPCVVRLIQDDSPMGRFNSGKTAYINDMYVCDGICEHGACAISNDGNLHHPACLEIIGYPVADGSAEWALWRMLQGERVIHVGLTPCNIHCNMVTWLDWPDSKQYTMQSPNKWLMYCPFKDGWQIYAKPLLAEAKVGWICEQRNGLYSQIKAFGDSWGTDDCFNPNLFTVFLTDNTTRNIYGTYLGTMVDPLPNDIISCEPLATEGTEEWALQMMKLGKCVCHVKAASIKYHRPTHYVKRVVRENCTDDMSDAVWMKGADPTGWQIYAAPKPLLADAKVGWICTHRNGKTSTITNTNWNPKYPIYCSFEDEDTTVALNGRNNVDSEENEYDVIHTEPLAPEGSAEWAWQMWCLLGKMVVLKGYKASAKDSWGVCPQTSLFRGNDVNYWREHKGEWMRAASAYQWQLYAEPKQEKPTYKVWDWVRTAEGDGAIIGIPLTMPDVKLTNGKIGSFHADEIFKLDPSEVVVHIGCLSGTVAYAALAKDCFLLEKVNDPQHRSCCIDMSMLDTTTRELVQSLLKAQEEK